MPCAKAQGSLQQTVSCNHPSAVQTPSSLPHLSIKLANDSQPNATEYMVPEMFTAFANSTKQWIWMTNAETQQCSLCAQLAEHIRQLLCNMHAH
jgi:hypothetical protein